MTDELINGPGVESKELAIRVYELYNPELKRFLEIDDRNSYRKGKDFATLDINDLPSIDHSQLTFAAHSIDATLDTEIVFASQSNCSREILTEITQVDVVNLPQPVFDSVFRYHSGYYLVPFGTKTISADTQFGLPIMPLSPGTEIGKQYFVDQKAIQSKNISSEKMVVKNISYLSRVEFDKLVNLYLLKQKQAANAIVEYGNALAAEINNSFILPRNKQRLLFANASRAYLAMKKVNASLGQMAIDYIARKDYERYFKSG